MPRVGVCDRPTCRRHALADAGARGALASVRPLRRRRRSVSPRGAARAAAETAKKASGRRIAAREGDCFFLSLNFPLYCCRTPTPPPSHPTGGATVRRGHSGDSARPSRDTL